MTRSADALRIALFLAILCLPLGMQALHVPEPTVELTENRDLAPPPDFATLSQTPRQLERYLGDHFPLRSLLVAGYLRCMEQWLAVPVRKEFKGKDGELYFIMTDEDTVRDYMGLRPLARAELGRRRAILTGLHAWCRAHDVAYLFAIGPNKPTIYPDWLPDWSRNQRGVSRREQMLAALADTPVPVLDLAPALRERRDEARSFNRIVDTAHWNGVGLRLANLAIVKRLQAMGALPESFESDARMQLRQYAETSDWGPETVPVLVFPDTEGMAYQDTPAFTNMTARMPYNWMTPYRIANAKGRPGAMLLASDSYFHTHVLEENNLWFPTPLAHAFQTFIQFHYGGMSLDALETLASTEDFRLLVHAYAERSLRWIWPDRDPALRILGDHVLGMNQTAPHQLTLAAETAGQLAQVTDAIPRRVQLDGEDVLEIETHGPAVLEFLPQEADAYGRVVLAMDVESPVAGSISLKRLDGPGEASATVTHGRNLAHLALDAGAARQVRPRLELPGAPGETAVWRFRRPAVLDMATKAGGNP